MIHRVAVVVAEPVAPVVAAAAVLRLAGLRVSNSPVVGLEAKVAAADVDDLAGLDGFDHAAGIGIGAIDPIVDAPGQAVDAMLLVAFLEARVEDDLLVGLAGAARGLGVEDVRGARHQHALAPRQDAGRKAEIVEEDGHLVIGAIGPGFFEELDAASPGFPLPSTPSG